MFLMNNALMIYLYWTSFINIKIKFNNSYNAILNFFFFLESSLKKERPLNCSSQSHTEIGCAQAWYLYLKWIILQKHLKIYFKNALVNITHL